MEAIAKPPAPEKLMILSWLAGSKGPFAPHLSTYLNKVGLKCGVANQLKRAILMGRRSCNCLLMTRAIDEAFWDAAEFSGNLDRIAFGNMIIFDQLFDVIFWC